MKSLIFTGESMRGILSGAKTQTRRVVNFHDRHGGYSYCFPHPRGGWIFADSDIGDCIDAYAVGEHGFLAPYPIGSRLYCKEAWGIHAFHDETDWYRGKIGKTSAAVCDGTWMRDYRIAYRADWGDNHEGTFWRSPRFMPAWASRATIEITDVLVDRVQDIGYKDYIEEGFDPCCAVPGEARTWYAREWDRINARRSPWARNDWVFAYSFRRVT